MVMAIVSTITSGLESAVSSIGQLAQKFVPVMVENLVGNAPLLAEGMRQLMIGVIAQISALVPTLVDALVQLLPVLLETGIQLLMSLADGVMSALPMLVTAVVGAIPQLVSGLVAALPALIQGGVQLLLGVVQGLVSAIPQLVSAVVSAIPQLVTGLVSGLGQIISGALQLFLGVVQGIVKALPQIISAVIAAIPVLVESLVSQLPLLIQGALDLFLGVITGILQALPQLITAIIGAIPQLVSALASGLPQIITGAIQLFLGIVTGLIGAIPQIITAVIGMIPQIVSALIDAVPQLLQAGIDLIAGLVQGISQSAGMVMDAIGGVVNGAIDWAKGLLGIKSPSRVFKQIGDFLGSGFAIGVLKSADKVRSATDKLVSLVKNQFDKLDDQREASRKREAQLEAKRAREREAAARKVVQLENRMQDLDAQRAAVQKRLTGNLSAEARAKAQADLERLARNRALAEKDLAAQKQIAAKGKQATRQQIWDERAHGRELDALRKKGSKALIASIKAQEKALAAAATAREKLAERLKEARDALSDAIKVRDDWAADIRSQVSQLGALAGRTSVGSMTGNLQAQIAAAKEFRQVMDQLMQDGLDKASVEELTAAFAQDGSLATVRALAAGGKSAVTEIVGLRKELDSVAGGIGKSTSTNLYQAGVDAAQGLVKGLESQAKQLEAAAKKLSDALVKSVKKALGIKSPSRVFRDAVGRMIPLGVLDGMRDRSAARRLDAAARELVPVPAAGAMRRLAAWQSRALAQRSTLSAVAGESISVVVEGDATPETAYEIAQRLRMERKRRKVLV